MNKNQNTYATSFFIDLRNSTNIINNKIKIYNIFYNKFRTLSGDNVEELKLKSTILFYKTFIGDAVFLHYKGTLTDESLDLIIKIQSMTQEIEKEVKLKLSIDVEFGIGISYGMYNNIEGGINEKNIAIPLSQYIDYASKSSSIARKNSKFYFAMKLKGIDDPNTNSELKNKICNDDRFTKKTSSSNKNFRFSFIK